MARTRPSIMSLGATMSAPASAWLAAVREQFQRRIVQNFSACDDAAMAVLHVFAQADVGDDQQRRQFLFQQAHVCWTMPFLA
jgi:hypothetical protein